MVWHALKISGEILPGDGSPSHFPPIRSMMDFLKDQIESLKRAGLHRTLRSLQGPQSTTTIIDGKRVLQLSSNNYLGLATHPRLRG